jgi:hypothetical protein
LLTSHSALWQDFLPVPLLEKERGGVSPPFFPSGSVGKEGIKGRFDLKNFA